jgi:tetratricopeptide (TPR) repeat protein
VKRYIGPNGQFTDRKSDDVKTSLEYYQAAIRLAEITTNKMKLSDFRRFQSGGAKISQSANFFNFLKVNDMRIYWLPTDPLFYPETNSPDAAKAMQSYIEKADRIWKQTDKINDQVKRKSVFAKMLYEKMLQPENAEGFGITFFSPSKDTIPKMDHPFYSFRLDCFGTWLFGVLCERLGINATPVQLFTNEDGKSIDHVLVGISLNPKRPDDLTLVSFHPADRGFDIKFSDRSSFAPISRLELLAYIHLTYAFILRPNDRQKQWQELMRAYRYAPHNYLVHYQLGVWYWNGGMKEDAGHHYLKSIELNPTYQPALKAIRDL